MDLRPVQVGSDVGQLYGINPDSAIKDVLLSLLAACRVPGFERVTVLGNDGRPVRPTTAQ